MKIVSKKTLLIAGLGFLAFAYGTSAIYFGIYFFWEAKYIGGLLLFIGLVSFINDIKSFRKGLEKKTTFENIGMVFIGGALAFQVVLFAIVVMPSTSYSVAIEFIKNDTDLKEEVGEIEGYTPLPYAGIEEGAGVPGKNVTGRATMTFIIKGKDKYKDASIHLVKKQEWKVVSIE